MLSDADRKEQVVDKDKMLPLIRAYGVKRQGAEAQQDADWERVESLVEAALDIDAGVFDEDGQCAICHAEGEHKPDFVCWSLHETLASLGVEVSDAAVHTADSQDHIERCPRCSGVIFYRPHICGVPG